VRGSVGGIKGLNFLIDTGAVPSVVDKRLSSRLGLVRRPDQVDVFARTVPTERVLLPSIDVGPIHAVGVEALAQDLSFIQDGLGERVDALIGLDVLGGRNFTIDYASQRLRFDTTSPADDLWARMETGNAYASIEVRFGDNPAKLLVDTGANHVVLFAGRAHAYLPDTRNQDDRISSNIGGAVHLKEVDAPSARLGEARLPLRKVYLLDAAGNLSLAFDGLLGVAALKPTRVDFDFERHAIGWKW
jgi:predicted aspartyl protease